MMDPVARVLALYRREHGDPPFERVRTLLLNEGLDALPRQIELDAEVRRLLGREPSIERWRASLGQGRDHDLALDAAVTAVLADHLEDASFNERARRVAAMGPSYAAAVARLRLVGELLRDCQGSAPADSDRSSADAAPIEPPCDFGPPIADHAHRFELRRLLGAGSNGRVYKAIDRRYSEGDYRHVVVVKILPPRLADRAESELLRGGRVQHPSVVRWLDSGIDPSGHGFVVSELVSGNTLEDDEVLARLGRRGAVDIVRQAASAIAAVHAAGVLHLDVKPANILVSEEGVARICDFGAAQPLGESDSVAESTPFFAAPELADGAPRGPAADIYALGAVLRWCIDELDALEAPPLERADAERLESIWMRAMDPSPSRRHPAARSLAEDLAAWLDHRPLPSEAPSLAASLQLSIRRDPATWGLGAAAVTAVALVAWLWIDGRIQASQRRAERLSAEAIRLRAQAALGQRVDQLGSLAQANGLSAAPQVLVMQWLVGDRGIRDAQLEARTISAQRNVWTTMVREADASGTRDHLEAKLAALCLAASDLEHARHDRADQLMKEDLHWWRSHFSEDDPIRTAAESVALLAEFEADPIAAQQDAASWRARLTELRRTFSARDARLERLAELALARLDRMQP